MEYEIGTWFPLLGDYMEWKKRKIGTDVYSSIREIDMDNGNVLVLGKKATAVDEMQCPEEQFISCGIWMNKGELLKHYQEFHSEYQAMDYDAMDVIFEQERTRRYDR